MTRRSIHQPSRAHAWQVLSIVALIGLVTAGGIGCKKKTPISPATLPDLVVTAFTLGVNSVSLASNNQVPFCYTLANTGAASDVVSTFDVTAYFSTDTTLSSNDVEWTGFYSASQYTLASNFSVQRCSDAGSLLTSGVSPGTYYVVVLADAKPNQGPNFYSGVTEENENNNWRASATQLTILP